MKKLTIQVSATLRALRKARGWSLDVASQKTGVSKAMLGQIERGESSPTIATLWKIASGFETSFSFFLESVTTNHIEPIYRKSNLHQIHPNDNKIRVMPIFPYDEELGYEVFIIELLPGCQHISPPHQRGVIEHVVVSEGMIEVLVNDAWYPLHKHEGLRFNADQLHGYRNTSEVSAVFHDMIHYHKINL